MVEAPAERLRQNAQRILTTWEARAHQEIASSLNVTSLVMRNTLDEFLELLADTLSKKIERTSFQKAQSKADNFRFAKRHGGDRATSLQGTLAELIQEFHILREVIFAVMEEDEPLPVFERNVILNTIEQTVNDAAAHFARIQTEFHQQFMLTLVHDLRNPITIAKTYAQVIQRHPSSSEPCVMAATKIDQKMNRLESMLRELLDAGRFKAGAVLYFDLEEMRLDALAREVVEELKQIHGDRIVLMASEPISGRWNREGLQRVIENLVVNAFKYGDDQAPVRIELRQTESRATISIHNEGNPISTDDQAKLFEHYQRASTAGKKTGWGLGLALVSGMAKAHGGSVRIASSRETGTDFVVELPKEPLEVPVPA